MFRLPGLDRMLTPGLTPFSNMFSNMMKIYFSTIYAGMYKFVMFCQK